MIRIELGDFSIDVPIEKRMTVQKFLEIADRLARISERAHHEEGSGSAAPWGAGERVYDTHETMEHGGFGAPSHVAPHLDEHPRVDVHAPSADDFRFEQESAHRAEYLLDQLSHQLDRFGEMQARLERLERASDAHHR